VTTLALGAESIRAFVRTCRRVCCLLCASTYQGGGVRVKFACRHHLMTKRLTLGMFLCVTFSRGALSRLPSLPMSAAEEPGRTSRTRGGYVPGMFRGIESVDAFADILRVPRKAIPLIVPLSLPCRSRGCPFNAILGNGNHCPAHQRFWYPLIRKRGLDLLGPKFLRSRGHFRGCDCRHAACHEGGYFPDQDAFSIPKPGRETVLATPGLFTSEKETKFRKNPKAKIFLYHWHFFSLHRESVS